MFLFDTFSMSELDNSQILKICVYKKVQDRISFLIYRKAIKIVFVWKHEDEVSSKKVLQTFEQCVF